MRRKFIPRKKSKRMFSKTAKRVKSKNFITSMRGGLRI
nr:MAG: hypothetical protein [Microvirus sp.]